MEIYRAEFNIAPVVIGMAPGFFFFSLAIGASMGSLLFGFVVAGLPILVLMFLVIASIRRSSAIVFADTFEYTTSLTAKSVKRIEASKIESVDFRESIIGRSNWGSVTVRGAGIRALRINNVRDPEKFAEALRSIASAGTSKNKTPQSTTMSTNLRELNELFKTGVISQQEFDKAKSKLLDL